MYDFVHYGRPNTHGADVLVFQRVHGTDLVPSAFEALLPRSYILLSSIIPFVLKIVGGE